MYCYLNFCFVLFLQCDLCIGINENIAKGRKFANVKDMPFYETSTKDGQEIDDLFNMIVCNVYLWCLFTDINALFKKFFPCVSQSCNKIQRMFCFTKVYFIFDTFVGSSFISSGGTCRFYQVLFLWSCNEYNNCDWFNITITKSIFFFCNSKLLLQSFAIKSVLLFWLYFHWNCYTIMLYHHLIININKCALIQHEILYRTNKVMELCLCL